jgi:hypothetical protein
MIAWDSDGHSFGEPVQVASPISQRDLTCEGRHSSQLKHLGRYIQEWYEAYTQPSDAKDESVRWILDGMRGHIAAQRKQMCLTRENKRPGQL